MPCALNLYIGMPIMERIFNVVAKEGTEGNAMLDTKHRSTNPNGRNVL